jgi:hypothetical protein
MRDLYNFYNSYKRKEGLINQARERDKAIEELSTELDKSIGKGLIPLRFFTHDLYREKHAVQNTLAAIEEME